MKLFISVVAAKVIVWGISYSACVVSIKTIISFSVCFFKLEKLSLMYMDIQINLKFIVPFRR